MCSRAIVHEFIVNVRAGPNDVGPSGRASCFVRQLLEIPRVIGSRAVPEALECGWRLLGAPNRSARAASELLRKIGRDIESCLLANPKSSRLADVAFFSPYCIQTQT